MYSLSALHVSSTVLHAGNLKMKMAENARPWGAWSNWKVEWIWLVASKVSLSFLHSCKGLVFSAMELGWSAHSHLFYTHGWFRDGHQPCTDWISEHWRAFVCWWEEKFFLPNWILIRKLLLGAVAIIWVPQGTDLMVKPGRQGQKEERVKRNTGNRNPLLYESLDQTIPEAGQLFWFMWTNVLQCELDFL